MKVHQLYFLAICIWHRHFLCRNVYILAPILSVYTTIRFVTCVILLREKNIDIKYIFAFVLTFATSCVPMGKDTGSEYDSGSYATDLPGCMITTYCYNKNGLRRLMMCWRGFEFLVGGCPTDGIVGECAVNQEVIMKGLQQDITMKVKQIRKVLVGTMEMVVHIQPIKNIEKGLIVHKIIFEKISFVIGIWMPSRHPFLL